MEVYAVLEVSVILEEVKRVMGTFLLP